MDHGHCNGEKALRMIGDGVSKVASSRGEGCEMVRANERREVLLLREIPTW
jgi:hypothetical protein